MTLTRAAATGAAFAVGAIAAGTAAAVAVVVLVDALARGAFPRALQRELRGRAGADDVRDRFGAH